MIAWRVLSKREKDARLKESAAKLSSKGEPKLAAKLLEMVSRKAPPKARLYSAPTQKERREEKRRRHAEETALIREAVWARSMDLCENARCLTLGGRNILRG